MNKLIALPLTVLAGACATIPPGPPPGPGTTVAYRASGTEPFWSLSIDAANITFTQPDAAPVQQPTPAVIHGFAGEIYQTPRINVNIVHARCSDGMSDRVYPDKVQITVDGKRFDGCGGL